MDQKKRVTVIIYETYLSELQNLRQKIVEEAQQLKELSTPEITPELIQTKQSPAKVSP